MNVIIAVAAIAAINFTQNGAGANAGANAGVATASAAAETRALPALHAQGDAADSVWRAGRRAIADEDWDRAIAAFQRLRGRYAKSAYFGDSYYWQAYALYQKGGQRSLREAVDLLDTERSDYAKAPTVTSGEARQLATRIRGQLARNGDEASAAEIARGATAAASAAVASVGSSVASAVGAAVAQGVSIGMNAAAGAAAGAARGARASMRSQNGCPSEEDDDRVAALNALLQMNGNDALPLLKQVLARRDKCSETLRQKAVFLVSQKRGTESADILMAAAKDDPDQEVREQAIFWLGQTGGDRAVDLLVDILKTSKDENIQDKAIFALSQGSGKNDRASAALRDYAGREDVSIHMREQAIFWLGQRKGEESTQFLRTLFGKTKNHELQDKIIFSLSQTKSQANQDFLIDQAVNKANSMEIRKQALFWAGQSGAADMTKLGALYDRGDDLEFREQVIFVLSQRSRDPAAVDKLIDIAKNEKNRDLRQKAIFWLGQSRDPKALKALSDLILKPE